MTKRLCLIFVVTLMAAVSCGHKVDKEDCFRIPYSPAVPPGADALSYAVWDVIQPVVGFHAPWDGLDDKTVFRCFATDSLFFFRFDVE